MRHWFKNHGERVEWLLTKTIEAGRASGTVAEKSLKRVSVDTTVMEKNVAHQARRNLRALDLRAFGILSGP